MPTYPFPDANLPSTGAAVSEHAYLREGPGTSWGVISELGAGQEVIAGFDVESDPPDPDNPTWRPVEVYLFSEQPPLQGWVASSLLYP